MKVAMEVSRHAHNLYNHSRTIAHIASPLGPPYTRTCTSDEKLGGAWERGWESCWFRPAKLLLATRSKQHSNQQTPVDIAGQGFINPVSHRV